MNKRFWALDTVLAALAGACVLLCVALAAAQPRYLAAVAVVFALWCLGLAFFLRRFRRQVARFLHGGQAGTSRDSFSAMPIPVLIVTDGRVAWYNDAFLADLAGGRDVCLMPLEDVLPGIAVQTACTGAEGADYKYGGRRYTVYGASLADGSEASGRRVHGHPPQRDAAGSGYLR